MPLHRPTPAGLCAPSELHLALLNPWQHGFPLERAPYARLALASGLPEAAVLRHLRRLQYEGSLSRIGGVFAHEAGGAALLAAMQVPPARLEAVAATVSAHPGVNHNYQREHAYNLWFVMTGQDPDAVDDAIALLQRATGLHALSLRMRRAYRIDLGFDLDTAHTPARNPGRSRSRAGRGQPGQVPPIADHERALAALVEDGLPLLSRPFDAWAEALGWPPEQVLATLQRWLDQGVLRRFGTVVRHHELGYQANAMTVFDVPDAQVDGLGERLACQPGVTLAYRRERAAGWPYNLYCMVHGQHRDEVLAQIAALRRTTGLQAFHHQVLFSCRRFKQTGARRFRALPPGSPAPHALQAPPEPPEIRHATA
ncbi:siroheme decarboxylase subunit beta [Aquabacterium sp. OR-4]|uniref:siroheme decarboxylase subunit beta n=1 Tax=Aquabacterium sp. OR-4 TaxID=2978127 RepID=UPI0028C58FF1|nr:Lrp/AsnC family transcriptional regulator [Aquabacterium sp. OR-4]MDT7838719.1 Lrp/AsnC family transcriptional regulator [Aquabacterium sp. OR-4]